MTDSFSWMTEMTPDGPRVTVRSGKHTFRLHIPPQIVDDDVAMGRFIRVRLAEIETRAEYDRARTLQRLAQKKIDAWERAEAEKQSRPPSMASALFLMLGPKKTAEAQLGDLEQMFTADLKHFGARYARGKFWGRVLKSVVPLIYGRLERLGVIAFLIDLGRRKLGL